MSWWIFKRGLENNSGASKCFICGSVGKTSCLPFLGKKRFCLICAKQIMGK